MVSGPTKTLSPFFNFCLLMCAFTSRSMLCRVLLFRHGQHLLSRCFAALGDFEIGGVQIFSADSVMQFGVGSARLAERDVHVGLFVLDSGDAQGFVWCATDIAVDRQPVVWIAFQKGAAINENNIA